MSASKEIVHLREKSCAKVERYQKDLVGKLRRIDAERAEALREPLAELKKAKAAVTRARRSLEAKEKILQAAERQRQRIECESTQRRDKSTRTFLKLVNDEASELKGLTAHMLTAVGAHHSEVSQRIKADEKHFNAVLKEVRA